MSEGTTTDGRGPSEAIWIGISARSFLIGLGFALAPRRLARLFGLPGNELTGASDFAWRLFAARNLVVGGAALAKAPVRHLVLPVQAVDQAIFLHALVTGTVPRRTALLAIGTSAAIIGACFAALRAEREQARFFVHAVMDEATTVR